MASAAPATEMELPVGSNPPAISFPHFPDRTHTFVWRNWQLVEPSRLAEVIGTPVENILDMAESMGLPAPQPVPPEYQRRAYITILRRNWHLLPYDQLLQLLDMSAEELSFSLREDDFLFSKLGGLKPRCEPLQYTPPTESTRIRTSQIKRLVNQHFGNQLAKRGEPRFSFVDKLSRVDPSVPNSKHDPEQMHRGLRFIYSYFALYGDPLLERKSDPYPEGLLSRLADVGVNGVWLHVVLRQLAPGGDDFPEFGAQHEQRLANLRRLVKRAKTHGIGVYLYMNEPRAMPPEFFKERPEMAGITKRDVVAMCTSDRRVLAWMKQALTHLFREVPDLGGVFTITASENLTNCATWGTQEKCPHCRHRSQAQIVAEVNAAIEAGVHAAAPRARVIAWDWGWNGHGDAPDVIEKLPDGVWLMSVSEWAKPFERGGLQLKVGEYSISTVGPGPRAQRHWELARKRGLKTVAKVQMNATWELSAVPYLPVMDLVAEHCKNLADEQIDGQMLSWSVGGYPSPNLEIAHRLAETPEASAASVLDAVAARRFGATAAPHAREAWTTFSKAFGDYPYDITVIYHGPNNFGPANLLYANPTGYNAPMVGTPYDDVRGWSGPYPPHILASQFRKVADQWAKGLLPMRKAVSLTIPGWRETAEQELRIAQTCRLHFASSANQVEFILARDALAGTDLAPADRQKIKIKIQQLIEDEISIARELYGLSKADSLIGFEASNQYYYVPLDLVEKVINCQWTGENLSVFGQDR
jgi:hypothetical protein